MNLKNRMILDEYRRQRQEFVKLGDVASSLLKQKLAENHDLALELAKATLANTELDILSSSVGLRFLCRAELLNQHYNEEQITEFLMLSTGDRTHAQRMAKNLLKTAHEKTI